MKKVADAWAGGQAPTDDEMWVGDAHMIRPSAVTGLRIREADPKAQSSDFAEASRVHIKVLDNAAMRMEEHRVALNDIAEAIRNAAVD